MERAIKYLKNELRKRNEYRKLHYIHGEHTENWVHYDETTDRFIKVISILSEGKKQQTSDGGLAIPYVTNHVQNAGIQCGTCDNCVLDDNPVHYKYFCKITGDGIEDIDQHYCDTHYTRIG